MAEHAHIMVPGQEMERGGGDCCGMARKWGEGEGRGKEQRTGKLCRCETAVLVLPES